jgi:hypothetical protein
MPRSTFAARLSRVPRCRGLFMCATASLGLLMLTTLWNDARLQSRPLGDPQAKLFRDTNDENRNALEHIGQDHPSNSNSNNIQPQGHQMGPPVRKKGGVLMTSTRTGTRVQGQAMHLWKAETFETDSSPLKPATLDNNLDTTGGRGDSLLGILPTVTLFSTQVHHARDLPQVFKADPHKWSAEGKIPVCVLSRTRRQDALMRSQILSLLGTNQFVYRMVRARDCQHKGTCKSVKEATAPCDHNLMPTVRHLERIKVSISMLAMCWIVL